MRRTALTRIAVAAALVLALVLVLIVLTGGGGSYQVNARFIDAGQLVKGDLVEIGGLTVGKITKIDLTDDNQARVALNITDDKFKPFHRGTRMTIRTVGLSGVANRFIEVAPGPKSAPEIKDGEDLTTAETTPVVDLDELLNALDAPTRNKLQSIIRDSSLMFAGDSAKNFNKTAGLFNPAVAQTRAFTDELVYDQAAFEGLVTSSSAIATALASRSSDLQQGIGHTATTLRTIAGERAALQSVLSQAPSVLTQSTKTLHNVDGTLAIVRPALRELKPVAPLLAKVLRQTYATGKRSQAPIAELRALLPALTKALNGLPGLATVAIPAVASTVSTLRPTLPILTGLRPYAPDVVAGILNGFGGSTSGYYDANGHMARISPHQGGSGQPGLGGLIPPVSAGDLLGTRTGLLARCPGGANEPAGDKSTPFIEDPSLCDPEQDHK